MSCAVKPIKYTKTFEEPTVPLGSMPELWHTPVTYRSIGLSTSPLVRIILRVTSGATGACANQYRQQNRGTVEPKRWFVVRAPASRRVKR